MLMIQTTGKSIVNILPSSSLFLTFIPIAINLSFYNII